MSKPSTRTTMAARAASALLLAASAALAGASAALLIGCGQRGPLYLPARQPTTPPSAAPPPPPPPPPPAPPPTATDHTRHARMGSVPPPLTETQTAHQAQAMPRCLIHIKRSPQRHRTVGSHFELYLHERHRPP